MKLFKYQLFWKFMRMRPNSRLALMIPVFRQVALISCQVIMWPEFKSKDPSFQSNQETPETDVLWIFA
jgi:hypothetical protein